jgi:TonB family protein
MRVSREALGALLLALLHAGPARAHEPDEEHEATRGLTAPVLIERVDAHYPEAARRDGLGGVVGLELSVAEDGHVASVKVVKPAGHGFDEEAVEAAEKFRFRPATRDGKPIASTVLFDQTFVVRPHLTAESVAEPTESATATAPPLKSAAPAAYESLVQGRGPTSAASASSIRNLDFDLRPKSSPNDILRVVPGLLAVQHQGGGKADQLFLRGFDADHGTDVGIFVDGVPINLPSHAHGQGFADLHWLIPEAIERIDVVKGPYDVRYGDFSTAGAVNLITRKTFDESSVAVTIGGFPTRGCDSFPSGCKVVAQERFVGIAAPKLGGWAEKLKPWVAFELARDDGPFVAGEKLYRYNLFAKVSYEFTPRTQAGVFFEAYGSGWIGSGQIPSREVDAGRLDRFGSVDPSEGGLTERQMVTAFLHHRDPVHEFDATVYFVRYRLSLWNDFTFFLRDPVNGDEIEQDDARTVTGANLTYHHHTEWRSILFRTTVGAQLRYDGVHLDLWDASSQNGDFRKRLGRHLDTSGFGFGNNDDVDQLNLAAFAEEDVVWNRYVRTLVGLRADYFGFSVDDKNEVLGANSPATSGSKQKTLLSPKATIVLTPWKPLDLFVNFGMGFHSNDARIAVQEGRSTPDGAVVNVVPRIYGGEVGARYSYRNYLSVAAAFWVSYLENETVFSGDSGAFVPADPTRRLGFDLEVRAQPLAWLYLDLDLAQADVGALALAPRLYLTGGATVKHAFKDRGGLRGGLRFRYLGARPAFDTTSVEYQTLNATDPRRVNADGYFVVDLYGAYRYRWFEVGVSIQNLFDTVWREAQFGNHSCTRDEAGNPANANFAVCGAGVADRTGVADVHFTPGAPFNLQLTLKAAF